MKAEKTISICGQDVQMLYCAATETGFEQLANRSINVFLPGDDNENPAATGDDYIKLGIAAIIAAYARNDQEPPVSVKDVLYEATPQEVVALITSAVELRAHSSHRLWNSVPSGTMCLASSKRTSRESGEKEKTPKRP